MFVKRKRRSSLFKAFLDVIKRVWAISGTSEWADILVAETDSDLEGRYVVTVIDSDGDENEFENIVWKLPKNYLVQTGHTPTSWSGFAGGILHVYVIGAKTPDEANEVAKAVLKNALQRGLGGDYVDIKESSCCKVVRVKEAEEEQEIYELVCNFPP